MSTNDDLLPNCVKHAKVMKEIEDRLKERKKMRIVDRKTWHEVITDEMDWVLVELGACKLIEDCVNLYDPEGVSYSEEDISVLKSNFNEYCHQIISPEHFPDELSFNQVTAILNSYLQGRWEEFKKNG